MFLFSSQSCQVKFSFLLLVVQQVFFAKSFHYARKLSLFHLYYQEVLKAKLVKISLQGNLKKNVVFVKRFCLNVRAVCLPNTIFLFVGTIYYKSFTLQNNWLIIAQLHFSIVPFLVEKFEPTDVIYLGRSKCDRKCMNQKVYKRSLKLSGWRYPKSFPL